MGWGVTGWDDRVGWLGGVKDTLLCRRQTSREEDRALESYLRREHRRLGSMRWGGGAGWGDRVG